MRAWKGADEVIIEDSEASFSAGVGYTSLTEDVRYTCWFSKQYIGVCDCSSHYAVSEEIQEKHG